MTMKTAPYAHQAEEFEATKDLEFHGRFWEMGTGKSKTTVDEMCHLFTIGKIDSCLVIAPKGMYHQWAGEQWTTHAWDGVSQNTIKWLWDPSSSSKKTVAIKADLLKRGDGQFRYLVMNVEALSSKKGQDFAHKFVKFHKCMVVVDESSTIKNPKAKRTKAIIALGGDACYRRVLTGTPVTNSPLDVFSQMAFLHHGICGSSFVGFRRRYALLKDMVLSGGRSFKVVTGFQRLDELQRVIAPYTSRVLKEDCLDLPPKVYMRRDVPLGDSQRRIYLALRDEALALLMTEGKHTHSLVTAPLMLVRLLRMRQVLCGFVSPDDEDLVPVEDDQRMSTLMDLLAETRDKVVIWANFQHSVKMIADAVGKEYGRDSYITYYGADNMTSADRESRQQQFRDPRSTVRFFIGTPPTGKWGLNLVSPETKATTMVYFSNDFSLEARQQSEDRLHRIGQTGDSVVIYDLIARETLDEKILDSLHGKRKLATQVTGDEWREWLN